MTKNNHSQYVKRTQKDYTMSFKLQVIQEVEQGFLNFAEAQRKYGIQGSHTVKRWIEKYGTFDINYQIPISMAKSKEQRIIELEEKVKLLERQKNRLEHEVERADKKVILFDMIIDIAEKEFNIPIRKKYSPELSNNLKTNKKKQ